MGQIDLPAHVRERSTLARVDYADTFRVSGVRGHSPRRWAQAMLTEASLLRRGSLLTGWTLLGLRLSASPSADTVLGWPVHADDEDALVLAARARLGLAGDLVFAREPGGVLFSTMVELRGPLAPRAWRLTEPMHVPVVRSLLIGAARRLRAPAG